MLCRELFLLNALRILKVLRECSENALRIFCGHSAVEPASARYSAIHLKVLWGALWEYSANTLRVLYRGALSAGHSASALGVLSGFSARALRMLCREARFCWMVCERSGGTL